MKNDWGFDRSFTGVKSCVLFFFAWLTSFSVWSQTAAEPSQGIGFFRPDYINRSVHYFYLPPTGETLADQANAQDSMVIMHGQYGMFDLPYQPSWLVPAHIRLDYGIFYLKVLTVGADFVEVVVNEKTGQTAFMLKEYGKTIYWPEFLLSVDYLDLKEKEKIRAKPSSGAPEVKSKYTYIQPLRITEEWLKVELVDENFNKVGEGWVKWRKNGKVHIKHFFFG